MKKILGSVIAVILLAIIVIVGYVNYNPLSGKVFAVYEHNSIFNKPMYYVVEKGQFHQKRHFIAELESKEEAKKYLNSKAFRKELKERSISNEDGYNKKANNYLKYNNLTKKATTREDASNESRLYGDVTNAKVSFGNGIIIKQGQTEWKEVEVK